MKGFRITQTKFINRTTAVERYIVEIGRYDILPESDIRLLIKDYKETGNPKSKQKVFESCAKFVVTCAKKYQNPGVDFMDLINAGNYGVLDALEHFKLDMQNCKFISYAMYYIRLYIQESLSESVESIKMPIKVKRNPESYSDNSPFRTIGKVALQPDTMSLNEPMHSSTSACTGENTPMSETLMTEDSWSSYNNIFCGMDIDDMLKPLSHEEKEIIINLFGLYNYPAKTIDCVASMMRLKKQRVISIRDKAIKKMRLTSQYCM